MREKTARQTPQGAFKTRKLTTTPKELAGPSNLLLETGHAAGDADLRPLIALKAYELYLERGRQDGHDREDWLEAERRILGETAPFNPALAPRDIV